MPSLIAVLAYLLTEFIPAGYFSVIDNMGVQWLYVSCLNIVVTTFIFKKGSISFDIFKNWLTYTWLLFCGWALISVFFALNPTEWLVTYSRLLITIIAFFNLALLLKGDRLLFRSVILMLIASGALQSLKVLYDFLNGVNVADVTLNLGNKNILAASLIIKFGFVLFSTSTPKRTTQYLNWLCMALMICAIYILSARSAIAGMAVQLLLFVYITLSGADKRKSVFPLLVTLAIFVLVSIQMQLWSKGAKNSYKKQTVTERLVTIKDDFNSSKDQFSRLTLWGYAADFIKTHPIFGGGNGNWKINSIPYEKKVLKDNYVSRHAHNDFLELAADTGIPGALVYIALFLICGWYLWQMIRLNRVTGSDITYAAPFAGMAAYLVDAFFNFPLERANMQVMFALIMALILGSCNFYFPERYVSKYSRPFFRYAFVIILLISSGALFVSWRVFESMRGEHIVDEDQAGGTAPHHSFDDMDSYFSGIPNITQTTIPIAEVKARYMIDEGRYDEALGAICRDSRANPYSPYRDQLLAEAYVQKGALDSAYIHYRQAYKTHPENHALYADMQKICVRRKDSIGLDQNFRAYVSQAPIAARWAEVALWYMQVSGNTRGALRYLDEGALSFPGDTGIAFHTHYLRAYDFIHTGAYRQSLDEGLKALAIRQSYAVIQNLGLASFGLNDYGKALYYFDMAVKKYGLMNGESTYFRGQCFMILGDKLKACADFAAAKNIKYPVGENLLQLCK